MAYGNKGGRTENINSSKVPLRGNKKISGAGSKQSFKMVQEVDSTNAKEIF